MYLELFIHLMLEIQKFIQEIFEVLPKKLKCKPLSENVKDFMDSNNKIFIECNNILKTNIIDWSTD